MAGREINQARRPTAEFFQHRPPGENRAGGFMSSGDGQNEKYFCSHPAALAGYASADKIPARQK